MARLLAHAPLALLLVSSVGCKEKEDAAPADKDPKSETQPKTDPAAAPIDAAPAAPAPLALSEEAVVIFKNHPEESHHVSWSIADSTVTFRTEKRSDMDKGRQDVVVLAKVGDSDEAPAAACLAWAPGQQGYVDLMQRADTVHIRCVTPPAATSDGKGETKAQRLRFETATKALAEAGSYEGEGLVDPDTIDLDEGE